MTRLLATLIAVVVEVWACLGIATLAKAQTYTNPNSGSRYAPQTAAAPGAAAGAPTRPVYGPQQVVSPNRVANPSTNAADRAVAAQAEGNAGLGLRPGLVRTVADEQPIRQPLPGAAPLPQAVAPAKPDWVPLPEDHQKYVDQILTYWQTRSDEITTYKCDFERWDYDPVFGPKDAAKTISEGAVQYAKPDKGLFKVEKISQYAPPAKAGDAPQYLPQSDYGEHWVCDGTQIFEFDSRKKMVIVRPLPPEMHGKAIADGPLPFLFGAKAATINARYWIRAITPPTAKGEYWLEAVPKSRQDSANFKMVHIILDEKDFLPKALQIFAPNFDPKTNPARQAYNFTNREVNNQQFNVLDKLNPFGKKFYDPPTPSGWKRVVEKLDTPLASPAAEQPREQTARPPMSPVPR